MGSPLLIEQALRTVLAAPPGRSLRCWPDEDGGVQWEVVLPGVAAPTTWLLLAAADGRRVQLSMSRRLARPVAQAGWRWLLAAGYLAGGADLDLASPVAAGQSAEERLLQALLTARLVGLPLHHLERPFDGRAGRWFCMAVEAELLALGHEAIVEATPAAAVAHWVSGLQHYLAGVLAVLDQAVGAATDRAHPPA